MKTAQVNYAVYAPNNSTMVLVGKHAKYEDALEGMRASQELVNIMSPGRFTQIRDLRTGLIVADGAVGDFKVYNQKQGFQGYATSDY